MYIDRITFARAGRSGTCSVCRKKSWHHGRNVVVRIVFRLMPGEEWMGLVICKKCLVAWLEKLA